MNLLCFKLHRQSSIRVFSTCQRSANFFGVKFQRAVSTSQNTKKNHGFFVYVILKTWGFVGSWIHVVKDRLLASVRWRAATWRKCKKQCDARANLYFPRGGGGAGEGTPFRKSYSYVPLQKVRFLCRSGLKTGIDFAHFGLESGMVFEGTTVVYEGKNHNGMALDERWFIISFQMKKERET